VDDALIREVQETISGLLRELANAIETESPERLSWSNVYTEELRAKVSIEEARSGDAENLREQTEMRLCAFLLDVASDLAKQSQLTFALETGAVKATGGFSAGTIA
jgi:hypothetical protein